MYYGSHRNPWRHGRLKVGAVLVLALWIRNLRGRSCQGDQAARPSSYVELMCRHALEINHLGGLARITVSVGKGFGSKGKQHHKHTASETQSHNK